MWVCGCVGERAREEKAESNPPLSLQSRTILFQPASPRALLSLVPADAATTTRTLTPLPIAGATAAEVGPSAFPAAETGGERAVAVSFAPNNDPAHPTLTLLLVTAPLLTPTAAAGIACSLAGLLPVDDGPGREVSIVAALPGWAGPDGAAAMTAPPATRVADAAIAALIHACRAVGVVSHLRAVVGHRPPPELRGLGDEVAAATCLGAGAEDAAGGVATFSPARAARMVPDRAAVRAVAAGASGEGGMTTEPEAGGLMFS